MNEEYQTIVDAILDIVLGSETVTKQNELLHELVQRLVHNAPIQSEFPVVCLCGSMRRFSTVMLELAQHLTFAGCIVVAPFVIKTTSTDDAYIQRKYEMLDRMHFVKIDMSTIVLVVDCTFDLTKFEQYIGEATSREIAYARSTQKKVSYLSTLIRHGFNTLVEEKEGKQ